MKPILPLQSKSEVDAAWAEMQAMPNGPEKEKWRKAIMLLSAQLAEKYDVPIEGKGPLDHVAEGFMRVVDYGAGVVRMVPNEALALGTGNTELAKEIAADSLNPFSKGAPTVGEVAERVGIPPGARASDIPGLGPMLYDETGEDWFKLQKGGPADPTARGAAAFAVDAIASPGGLKALARPFARDPLAGLKASEVAALKRAAAQDALHPTNMDRLKSFASIAVDPLGEVTARGSRGIYNSAFKEADRAALDAGAGRVSDVAYRNNVWGTSRGVERGLERVTDNLSRNVEALEAKAATLNPTARMSREELLAPALQDLQERSQVMGATQGAKAAVQRLTREMDQAYGPLDDVMAKRDFNIAELGNIKSTQQEKAAAQRAYMKSPPSPGRGIKAADNLMEAKLMGQGHKTVARTARQGVENLADLTGEIQDLSTRRPYHPGLGGEIYRSNADISSILASQDAIEKAAKQNFGQTLRREGPTAAFMGVLGTTPMYALGKTDPWAVGAAALTGAALSTTAARTGLGLAGSKVVAPYMTPALRSYYVEKYYPELREGSPWDNITK